MSRFKRPEPFGKAGLTVAILALVLAMVGGAWAAGGLTGQQEKQVKKIAKKYAGKPGPVGPAGPAGTNGTNGTNGKNGAPGAPGPKGSPWTAGGVLPSEKTETGSWSGGAVNLPEGEQQDTSASFPIRVEPAPTFVFVPAGPEGEPGTTASCPGISGGVPTAEPGKFCVYAVGIKLSPSLIIPAATVEVLNPATNTLEETVSPAGARLKLTCPSSPLGACVNFGTWAVTAE